MKLSFLICVFLGWAWPVWAATSFPNGMTAQDIQSVVAHAAADQGYVADVTLSPARRYPRCDHVPEVAPLNQSWETVQVICQTPQRWVRSFRTGIEDAPQERPVIADADQEAFVVLSTSLSKGAVITADDLDLREADVGSIVLGFHSPQEVIGRRMRQNLGKGRVLLARHLEQNWMIETDHPVQIVYDLYGIEVIAPGRALDNGQFGDLIGVENTSTSEYIRGTVVSQNKIKVRSKIK